MRKSSRSAARHAFAYFSGQVPVTRAGAVPGSFAEQSRLIWRNIEAQLVEVGMTLDNVVKATTFLSDRNTRSKIAPFAPRSWARVRGRSPSSFAASSTKRGCLRSRSSRRPKPPSLPRREKTDGCAGGAIESFSNSISPPHGSRPAEVRAAAKSCHDQITHFGHCLIIISWL